MMKLKVIGLIVLCWVSTGGASVPAVTLFSDTYDRPDNTDIDASSAGMSGTLSPLTYVEIGDDVIYPLQSGTGNPYPELTRVEGNQLFMASGTNMSTMYLDHNFVDGDILTADGLRVGLTILQDLGPQTGGQFFVGFGVGNTLQECQDTWFDHNGTGFRGQINTTPPREGTSDLWIGWSPANNGCIQVFKNGPTAAGGENYVLLSDLALTGNDRLELELFFDSFVDGSPVNANILWNGAVVGTERFAWDADGLLENYIGINGRQGAGWVVDDLAIDAIYSDRAYSPSPADGATLVSAAGLTLSWYKGKDAAGNPNAAIGQHYLYIAPDEPNFVDVAPITVADTTDPVADSSYTFASDTLYYWRVDESINGSPASDANTLTGFVWSFDTYTFPIITADPGQILAAPAETAELTCEFTSVTTPTVTWFKEAGDVDLELVDGGDIETPQPVFLGSDAYRAGLKIHNVEAADEGAYYCVIENLSGSNNAVTSHPGGLGVKRTVAHWTLDRADLVGGQYLDSSGEGHHGDPNIIPADGTFVPGADTEEMETAEGLNLGAEPLAAADSGEWAPSMYTGEMTVSAWLRWAGSNGSWQGVVSNRVGPANSNFYIEVRQDNGNLQIGGIPGVGDLQIAPLPTGDWVHLAIAAKAGEVVIYLNGQALNSSTAGQAVPQTVYPLYVGALGRNAAGTLLNPFNGIMDDVQVFNYALTATEVVDVYFGVLETAVCLNPDGVDLAFDVAGGGLLGDEPDCRVSLADFAVFANTWLECGLYPQTDCP